jgi:hypothetical protein
MHGARRVEYKCVTNKSANGVRGGMIELIAAALLLVGVGAFLFWKKSRGIDSLAKSLGFTESKEMTSRVLSGAFGLFPVVIKYAVDWKTKAKSTELALSMKPCGFHIIITKESSLAKLGDDESTRDIVTNNMAFDTSYTIKCGSELKAMQVVNEELANKFVEADRMLLSGEFITADNDRVTFVRAGKHEAGEKTVKSVFSLMAAIAKRIQDTQVRGNEGLLPEKGEQH